VYNLRIMLRRSEYLPLCKDTVKGVVFAVYLALATFFVVYLFLGYSGLLFYFC
jgi:hypothetical protein